MVLKSHPGQEEVQTQQGVSVGYLSVTWSVATVGSCQI